jgi:hypothetical protein
VKQSIAELHKNDDNGNPAGGVSSGVGIAVTWQNGPLGRGADRKSPNGAFVEGVIQVAIGRLKYYQDSRFACESNASALVHLEAALAALEARTAEREARAVEGTHVT